MSLANTALQKSFEGDLVARSILAIPSIPNGAPSTRPGSIGVDKLNKVYVRGVNGTVVLLSENLDPVLDTLTVSGATALNGGATVTGGINVLGGGATVDGGLFVGGNVTINGETTFGANTTFSTGITFHNNIVRMPSVANNTADTRLFNVTYGDGAPTSTVATPGSLYFDNLNDRLYYYTGASWVAVPLASGNPSWSDTLAVSNQSGAVNPLISTSQQLYFQTGIKIGGNNTLTGAAHATGVAIGPSAVASASGSVAIGTSASSAHTASAALGDGATTTDSFQVMLGAAGGLSVVTVPNYLETAFTEGARYSGGQISAIATGNQASVSWFVQDYEYHRLPPAYTAAVLPSTVFTLKQNASYMFCAYMGTNFNVQPTNGSRVVATIRLLIDGSVPMSGGIIGTNSCYVETLTFDDVFWNVIGMVRTGTAGEYTADVRIQNNVAGAATLTLTDPTSFAVWRIA